MYELANRNVEKQYMGPHHHRTSSYLEWVATTSYTITELAIRDREKQYTGFLSTFQLATRNREDQYMESHNHRTSEEFE